MTSKEILPGNHVYWEVIDPPMGKMRFRGIVLPPPRDRLPMGWKMRPGDSLVFVTAIDVVVPPGWWGETGLPGISCLVPRNNDLWIDDGSRLPGRRLWWLGKKQKTKKERRST